MTAVFSSLLGELHQDKDIDDWWVSKAVAVPFFDGREFPIVFVGYDADGGIPFIEEADDAIKAFLTLTAEDRLKISGHVFGNYLETLEAVGLDQIDERLHDIEKEEDIWSFVTPSDIYVAKRHRRDRDIYIKIACECLWEEEHGLQLVFRRGRQLTRVSDQDGHLTEADAYDKPDDQDALLAAFKA